MAKSQKRSNREAKKPKAAKTKVASTTAFPMSPAPGRKSTPAGANPSNPTK